MARNIKDIDVEIDSRVKSLRMNRKLTKEKVCGTVRVHVKLYPGGRAREVWIVLRIYPWVCKRLLGFLQI